MYMIKIKVYDAAPSESRTISIIKEFTGNKVLFL
jgi:hypothetical protein